MSSLFPQFFSLPSKWDSLILPRLVQGPYQKKGAGRCFSLPATVFYCYILYLVTDSGNSDSSAETVNTKSAFTRLLSCSIFSKKDAKAS